MAETDTTQMLRLFNTSPKLNYLFFSAIAMVFSVAILSTCTTQKREIIFPKTDLSQEPLIPLPLEITSTGSGFALDQFTHISVNMEAAGFKDVGEFLTDKIRLQTGLNIQVSAENDVKTIISIQQMELPELNKPEAYQLHITEDSILLTANSAAGAFRGVQTIRQLIPAVANDTLAENSIWVIPTGSILDAPQYEFRSAMLDVARHFFSVADVKKYIELLAYYKINTLHLHLTDDQGWRIEIKSWIKLTTVGGSTEVGGGPGGFYTQADYTEIVNFAAAHHMTIIPEIDMPGHTNAAALSYPFLNGNGKALKAYTGMRVGFSTLATRKDTIYTFLDDVIRELAALTPGPYFHIGGDESHVTKKADYIYFINKVEKIVQKYGKQMIGWDEVAITDIDSTSIVQLWRSAKNKDTAIEKGMKIILSPAFKTYLDMKYDSSSRYGLTWAGYIPVDTAYIWEPESYAPKESILGLEAPLWSETIADMAALEYLAFPRVIGYAELGWTVKEKRNWEDYKERLAHQALFLDRMKVNYYPSPLIDWKTNQALIPKN